MKLNLGSGAHPLEGFENIDVINWAANFPNGDRALPFDDESVDAITISHYLMYIPETLWQAAFLEMYRVLKPGGVLRITEDSTMDPESPRYGGFPGYQTLTSPEKIREHMGEWFVCFDCSEVETHYDDASLIQRWHGEPPKVFHIEGIKLECEE